MKITIVEGLTCPNCAAREVEDNTLPVAEWVFNIRAFRVDDWSECRRCGVWFDMDGYIDNPEDPARAVS
jgi:hypothetical protein